MVMLNGCNSSHSTQADNGSSAGTDNNPDLNTNTDPASNTDNDSGSNATINQDSNTDNSSEQNTNTSSSSNTNSDSGANTTTNPSSNTDSNSEQNTNTSSNSNTDTNSSSNTNSGSSSNTENNSGQNTGTNPVPNTDAGSDTGNNSEQNTETNTNTNSGSGTNTDNNSGQNTDTQEVVETNWYRPPLSVSWQWQLGGTINTAYDVELYDIDLFNTKPVTIQSLQAVGKKVICYFSAGSYESFREDKDQFKPEDLGNTLDGWEDEKWLDIRSPNVRSIMQARLALAHQKGCDGVEPDNMDGYTNNPGFDLTAADQLAFNRFIAEEAHKKGLSVGLKNDLEQVNELIDYFDFAVNEQCFEYSECDLLLPFTNSGKPVLNAEYASQYIEDTTARQALCNQSLNKQFSTLILPLDLDDKFRYSCF